MRKNNHWLYIIGILLLLTALLAVLIVLQSRPQEAVDHQYYLAEIDFSRIDKHTEIGTRQNRYEGYLLSDIMENISIDIDTLSTVTFHARDGVRMIVNASELSSANTILEVSNTSGGTEYRLIFPYDQFRNRWLKDVAMFKID